MDITGREIAAVEDVSGDIEELITGVKITKSEGVTCVDSTIELENESAELILVGEIERGGEIDRVTGELSDIGTAVVIV